jgi:sulfatase maturation enzyme AslB (radical SAM superfamily)
MSEISKTYCPLPWRNVTVMAGDEIHPCCQFQDNALLPGDKTSIVEVFNSSEFNLIREKMLSGQRVGGCSHCYQEEEAGFKSARYWAIKDYGQVVDPKIETVEIMFDNVCNSKCRDCASPHSHLWYEDEIKLYGTAIDEQKYTRTNDDLYMSLDCTNLTEIHFFGGEPLVSPLMEPFCEKLLKEANFDNLNIRITTNCTLTPGPNLEQVFLKCKKLTLTLSIDAHGKLNDYFRHGSKFEKVTEVVSYFYNLANVVRKGKDTEITTNTAVNVYNVNMLDDLEKWLETKFPGLIMIKSFVHSPPFLSIQNTPADYKEELTEILKTKKDYAEVISYLNGEGEDMFPHFINFHKKLDEIRNESLDGLNPLLEKYITKYSSNRVDSKVFFLKVIESYRDEKE